MTEYPVPYDPALDVEVLPDQGNTDERAQVVAVAGAQFQQLIRDSIPAHPYVEQAVRHVELAVQAALTAAQESPPAAPGDHPGGGHAPQEPTPHENPRETPREPSRTGK